MPPKKGGKGGKREGAGQKKQGPQSQNRSEDDVKAYLRNKKAASRKQDSSALAWHERYETR